MTRLVPNVLLWLLAMHLGQYKRLTSCSVVSWNSPT